MRKGEKDTDKAEHAPGFEQAAESQDSDDRNNDDDADKGCYQYIDEAGIIGVDYMFFPVYLTGPTIASPHKVMNNVSAEVAEVDNNEDGNNLECPALTGNGPGQMPVSEGKNYEQVECPKDIEPEKKAFVFLLGVVDAFKNSFCKNEECNINRKDDHNFCINVPSDCNKVRKNVTQKLH